MKGTVEPSSRSSTVATRPFMGTWSVLGNVNQKIGRQRLEFGHGSEDTYFSAPLTS